MSSLGKIGVLGVPYDAGSKKLQLSGGAKALREAGIVSALGRVGEVVDFGDLSVDLQPVDRSDPKLLNPGQVEALCKALAAKVKEIVGKGCLPLFVGGDCSLLFGVVEGLWSPRLGVLYMDAHGDFNTSETTPSGIIGGMCLAAVTGRGSKRLTRMFGHEPLLQEGSLVLYGVRDLDPLEAETLAKSKVKMYTRHMVKASGAEKTAKEACDYLSAKCDGVYLHVDLDVLDKSLFAAQGLAVPDGLLEDEFGAVLRALAKSGKLRCMSLVAFDAGKDADGGQAKKLVDLVVEALV